MNNVENEFYAGDTSRKIKSVMLKAIADYSKNDRAGFIKTLQEAQERAGELEKLICKIHEDIAKGVFYIAGSHSRSRRKALP